MNMVSHFSKRLIKQNFRETICLEIKGEVLTSQEMMFKALRGGNLSEQENAYRGFKRDLDILISIGSRNAIISRFNCVGDALHELVRFLETHAPITASIAGASENSGTTVTAPGPKESFTYIVKSLIKGEDAHQKKIDCLNQLLKELQDLNMISHNEDKMAFRALFNGKKVKKQVQWLGNQSQLHVFIDALTEPSKQESRGVTYPINKKWITTAACFVDKNGKPFTIEGLNSPGIKGNGPKLAKELRAIHEFLK
ncbi:hypothetical protein ACFQT0_18005 [Hymenobacter humi]|uniref:Uncharacterized protein n=1 Tax=Hymenobacter humi TaxID=1411620 RepID=A0ABW2U830_9BACT